MNRNHILMAGAFILILFASISPEAKEYKTIKIEPGNYEFSETSSTTQELEDIERVTQRCLRDDTLDPAGDMVKRDGCLISNVKSKGDKISFDFLCDRGPGTSRVDGSAEFSGGGKEFSWKKEVNTEMSGDLTFSINSKGKAVRKGECPGSKQDKESVE